MMDVGVPINMGPQICTPIDWNPFSKKHPNLIEAPHVGFSTARGSGAAVGAVAFRNRPGLNPKPHTLN